MTASIQYGDFSQHVHEQAGSHHVIKAQMELTYRCNLRCRHCYTDPYNNASDHRREMSLDEVIRILDEMAEAGILWLNLTGGEALARPDFFEIYDHAYAKGFLLVLYSNGTTLTEAVIEKLQARPPFFIDVSCPTTSAERFDWFTKVNGSYGRFRQGLDRLKASGLPFRLKSLAMNWNQDEWGDLRQFVESYGVPFRYSTMMSPALNGDLAPFALRLSPAAVVALDDASARYEPDACDMRRELVGPPASDHLYRCSCGTNAIHISAWAELGTCTMEYGVRASLREYAVPEAIDRVFGKVHALRYEGTTPCRACELHAICEKKPASAMHQFQDPEAPDPYACDLAFLKVAPLTTSLRHPLSLRGDKPCPT